MSNDELLKALGRLSARQSDAPLPPDLTAPAPAATRQRIADQALAALRPPAREDRPPLRGDRSRAPGWIQRLVDRRTLLVATPMLGAAAAVALLVRGRALTPLPLYTMQVRGGVADVRGEAPAGRPLDLAEGSPVELRLRPQTAIAPGGLEVQLAWSRAGREIPWTTATTEISDQGAVRITGRAARPFGPGDGELIVRVGRPGGPQQTLRTPVRWR